MHYQCNSTQPHLDVGDLGMIVAKWNGRMACAFQEALRLTNEGFAEHLRIAVRTVAGWHENPDMTPRADIQQILDAKLASVDAEARSRFGLLIRGAGPERPQVEGDVIQAAGRRSLEPGLNPHMPDDETELARRMILTDMLASDEAFPRFSLLEIAETIRREIEDTLASGTLAPARLARVEEVIAGHLRLYTTTPPATALAGLLLDFMDVRRMSAARQPAVIQARLSEISTMLATLAADSLMKLGRVGEARSWYGTARIAADDSGNRDLQARVRAQEAMLPYYYGQPGEVVRLAREARELLADTPRAAGALAAAAEARALAKLGRRADAEAAMAAARDLSELAGEPDNDEAFRFGERRLLFYQSGTLANLGEAARAEPVRARALELYGDTAPVIDPVLIRLDQAQLLISEGEPAAACSLVRDSCLSLGPEFRTRVLAARLRQVAEAMPADHEGREALAEVRRSLFPPTAIG